MWSHGRCRLTVAVFILKLQSGHGVKQTQVEAECSVPPGDTLSCMIVFQALTTIDRVNCWTALPIPYQRL